MHEGVLGVEGRLILGCKINKQTNKHLGLCTTQHMCRGQRTTYRSQVCWSRICVLKIKLRSSYLQILADPSPFSLKPNFKHIIARVWPNGGPLTLLVGKIIPLRMLLF